MQVEGDEFIVGQASGGITLLCDGLDSCADLDRLLLSVEDVVEMA